MQQNLRGVGHARRLRHQAHIARGLGGLDQCFGQVGVDIEIEPGWAFLDPAEDEMLHCIVADGPEFQ